MRKIFIILLIIFFMNFQIRTTQASIYSYAPRILSKLVSLGPSPVNIAIGLAIGGSIIGYQHYKDVSQNDLGTTLYAGGYTQANPDGSRESTTFDEAFYNSVSAGSMPQDIVYGGKRLDINPNVKVWGTTYNWNYCNTEEHIGKSIFDTGSFGSYGIIRYALCGRLPGWQSTDEPRWLVYEYKVQGESEGVVTTSGGSEYHPNEQVGDIDTDTTVPPISIPVDRGIQGIVDSINQQLADAGAIERVTEDDVLDLLPTLPREYVDQIKANSSPIESAMIDDAIDDRVKTANPTATDPAQAISDAIPKTVAGNVAVEQAKPVDIADTQAPAVPDVGILPPEPVFSTDLPGVPEQVDFLEPVKNFINNIFNSVPFLAAFRDANIETSSASGIVTISFSYGDYVVDFNEWNNIFLFMSKIIIFIVSVYSVIIIVKE